VNLHSLAPLPLCYLEQKSQRPVISGESITYGFVPKLYYRNNTAPQHWLHVQSQDEEFHGPRSQLVPTKLSPRTSEKGGLPAGKVVIRGKTVLLMKAELRESGEHFVGHRQGGELR